MIRRLLPIVSSLVGILTVAANDVLIVADEFPAMQFLAEKLKAEESLAARVVDQDHLPVSLATFRAVVVYIHGELKPSAEGQLIDYTRAGGSLTVLHHSISSGKRNNRDWFDFLGISLPTGEVADGGYQWIEPATLDIVNLAPDHFITTHKVHYPIRITYPSPVGDDPLPHLPAFTLTQSEVYLNHSLTRPRTLLLGFRFVDPAGKVYQQNTAGWITPAGQGHVVYLKPGHSQRDFENPTYLRIALNAVIFRPNRSGDPPAP